MLDKDYKHLPTLVLTLITTFDDFRSNFQNTFLQTHADVESFKVNPNCSCKYRIIDFIEKNRNDVFLYIENWHKNHSNIDLMLLVKPYIFENVSGKVFRIDKNDKAFEEFSKKIIEDKFSFRAFDIVYEGDKIAFYFI